MNSARKSVTLWHTLTEHSHAALASARRRVPALKSPDRLFHQPSKATVSSSCLFAWLAVVNPRHKNAHNVHTCIGFPSKLSFLMMSSSPKAPEGREYTAREYSLTLGIYSRIYNEYPMSAHRTPATLPARIFVHAPEYIHRQIEYRWFSL